MGGYFQPEWVVTLPRDLHILTKAQVAEFFQIQTKKVDWLVRSRKIPFCKIGRTIRFIEKDIIQWICNQKNKYIEI